MTIFGNYARYYDLLYGDKDYGAEARFVEKLLQKLAPGAKSLLELGCGTGRHAFQLATLGYEIHGIDISPDMVERARERLAQPGGATAGLSFSQGDLRTVRLGRQFDAIISLFHVMSYQTGDQDLQAAMGTAAAHLKSGGVFIFDFWYGPAVLTDRPVTRVKRVQDEAMVVTRLAEPVMLPNENVAEINYQIFVEDRASGRIESFRETHRMRYLFMPEIKGLFAEAGLDQLAYGAWQTGKEPGFDTWGVYAVGRK